MKLGQSYDFLNGREQSRVLDAKISLERSQQRSKKKEFELYFPGLSGQKKGKSISNEGNTNPVANTLPKEATSGFANQLQKDLSREEISAEVKKYPEKKKLYEAALEFQSLFVDRMLNAMRKNLDPKSDLLYGGFQQKIFQDMLYEEYSRMLSRTDNFTLAEDIYRQASESQ